MGNTFIQAQINDTVIYIKIGNGIIHSLFDVLHDSGYKIQDSTIDVWDYHIEVGTSYEVLTEEELEDFIEVNDKANKIRNNGKR